MELLVRGFLWGIFSSAAGYSATLFLWRRLGFGRWFEQRYGRVSNATARLVTLFICILGAVHGWSTERLQLPSMAGVCLGVLVVVLGVLTRIHPDPEQ